MMGRIEHEGTVFWLSHYPWRELMDGSTVEGLPSNMFAAKYANRALPCDSDAVLLHGHTHQRDARLSLSCAGRMVHVGWDTWRRPVSLDEVASLVGG